MSASARVGYALVLAENGKAVVLSSHILTELAEVCDSVAVIEAGKLQAKGHVEEMTREARAQAQVACRVLGDPEQALLALAEMQHVANPKRDADTITFSFSGTEEERAALLAEMVKRGFSPVDFASRNINALEPLLTSWMAP